MSNDQKQQDGRVAIVTGAWGGIGEATALALAQAGYRVFGTGRKPPQWKPAGVEYLVCDVTSDASVEAAFREVLAKAGRIDLLVNNAGAGLMGGAEESSIEQAKSLFDVNLFGVMRTTKAVLPVMRHAHAVMRDVMNSTADLPEVVAKTVLKACITANPRSRYAAGKFARQVSLLRRFVPASAFDKSLRKQMRLPA